MRLFDDGLRLDDSVRRSDEDTFAFLNRVDDVYFGRVRDLVETWFAAVPSSDQPSLRGRLRSNSEANSDPAFWELCLRELLRRSGYTLTHEPKRAHRRSPDFLAVGQGTSFYVEARFVGAQEQRRARDVLVEQIKDQLKKVESDDFLLYFDIRRYGKTLPPLRAVRRAVEEWLSMLPYAEVAAAARAKAPLPERTFPSDDWIFWFRAIPRAQHARGRRPRAGAIGMGPITRSGDSAADRLAQALTQKAGYYGDFEKPFVLALCCGEVFVDYEDIVSALYGNPAFAIGGDGDATPFREQTGLFSGRGHPRVSAVLTVRDLRPWLVQKVVPVLWRNPNAQCPLDTEFPWTAPGWLEEDGTIAIDDPALSVASVLGLDEEWPGPERALRVRASAARD